MQLIKATPGGKHPSRFCAASVPTSGVGSAQVKKIDQDLIGRTMQEAQRLSAEPGGPTEFKGESAIEAVRDVLNPRQTPRNLTHRGAWQIDGFDLERVIRLRWTLRDIKGKRTRMSPVSPDDLKTLIEMKLVEMRNDVPVPTYKGHRVLDWS